MTNTSPSAFPVLMTVKRFNEVYRGQRSCTVCSVCRLALDPRLVRRHAKACAARKRANPARWSEWLADMREVSR